MENALKANEAPGFYDEYTRAIMGSETSGFHRVKKNLRPAGYTTDPRVSDKFKDYNLDPLSATREDVRKWQDTVLNRTGNSPSWLDTHNSELTMGVDENGGYKSRDIAPITEEEVKRNPTLARLLAGFALQDSADAELSRIEKENPVPVNKKRSENKPKAPELHSDDIFPSSYLKNIAANNQKSTESVWAQHTHPAEKKGKLAAIAEKVGSALKKLKFW